MMMMMSSVNCSTLKLVRCGSWTHNLPPLRSVVVSCGN